MQHITSIISHYIAEMRFEDVPHNVLEQLRLFLLDYYASCMAGRRINRSYDDVVRELFFSMGGREEASVLFCDKRLPAMNAAFLNASCAHGADMDDGNRKAMGHVAAPVIPAVLALAETLPDVTERDVAVAILAGYEVYCRLAAGVQPGLVKRGFHSTGTAGALAAAAACAKLMKLDEHGIYQAIALACTQASGLLIVAESGQVCKPMNPAKAVQSGILSALMASRGVESFDHPLESAKGWFHAMSDKVDEGVILDTLGKSYSIMECYLKPFPSCRHTHCGLEAASQLYAKLDAPIRQVKVYIYPNAISIAGQIIYPKTNEDAKFSIHYSLACMLSKGSFGLDDLSIGNADPMVRRLTERIELIADESMENRDRGIRGARVELFLENGKVLSQEVLIPKGDPENPMTQDEVIQKIRVCGEQVQTVAEQDTRIARILKFGTPEKYRQLL